MRSTCDAGEQEMTRHEAAWNETARPHLTWNKARRQNETPWDGLVKSPLIVPDDLLVDDDLASPFCPGPGYPAASCPRSSCQAVAQSGLPAAWSAPRRGQRSSRQLKGCDGSRPLKTWRIHIGEGGHEKHKRVCGSSWSMKFQTAVSNHMKISQCWTSRQNLLLCVDHMQLKRQTTRGVGWLKMHICIASNALTKLRPIGMKVHPPRTDYVEGHQRCDRSKLDRLDCRSHVTPCGGWIQAPFFRMQRISDKPNTDPCTPS